MVTAQGESLWQRGAVSGKVRIPTLNLVSLLTALMALSSSLQLRLWTAVQDNSGDRGRPVPRTAQTQQVPLCTRDGFEENEQLDKVLECARAPKNLLAASPLFSAQC